MNTRGKRVDHVIFCIEPENITKAATTFATLLDIEFEGPLEAPGTGLVIYVDWGAGIELMTPSDPSIAREQRAFLDEHGEGVFRICFNFPDRDEALDRAEQIGITVRSRFDVLDLFPQWHGRFSSMLESHLERVHGVGFNFCQIEEGAEQPAP
ncbi:VOC family protein [Streptomyces sp. NPDC001978]|uniref:VOC family protein n=1 Tax=Streptomyces sp. NPDC001978 TaxID=3364627 RepID=UPI0036C11C2A